MVNIKGLLDQITPVAAGVIGLDLILGFFGQTFLAQFSAMLLTGELALLTGYLFYRIAAKKFNGLPVPL